MSSPLPPPYYRIWLDPPPTVIFPRSNRMENFRIHYSGHQPHVLEINYLQEGNLCERYEGVEHIYEQGTIHTLVDNRDFTQYSTYPVLHEFFLYIAFSAPAVPISEAEICSWHCDGTEAIVPEYVTDPALCRQLRNLIKEQVRLAAETSALQQLQLRSCLYSCLTLLTEYAIRQARINFDPDTPVTSLYTQKACQYIKQNLAEHFTVNQVADAAGISYNHLKSLFLKDTGMTMVEYANRARIQSAEQLLMVKGMTLEKAGSLVGIPDPTYLGRLFRRYTGMSVQQYRKLHRK